ncbi:MAG: FAD-dependent oxidoreductase [Microbacterium sp.]|uniref:FAD-dependent oxidoreductase n=1 Tax=Microbacterium sp. TaxID=51671 RepID=UPI001AD1EB84|nr:FAD-dependent oxidoreductase [Microbacterium sp.]MBN9175870.1 FAD-dependent oxidoreductase [Microbacterium sp.]
MRIIIVGGVAAGMSAAARARRLSEDAEIIVLERGTEVSFANCGLPYHVSAEIDDAEDLRLHTPQSLRAALNLDVRIDHEVTAIDTATRTLTVLSPDGAQTLAYDALVLAPGAAAVRPPLPGIGSPQVRTLRTVTDAIELRTLVDDGARRAVVLGAGYIGIEAAEAMRHRGLEVDVVELAPNVLPRIERELARVASDELERLGIRVHAGVAATAITSLAGVAGATVTLSDGRDITADIVILSVGVRPDTAFAMDAGIVTERGAIVVDERGRTSAAGVWAAGDATLSVDATLGIRRPVALAGPANRAGRLIADDIFGAAGARAVPAALGTAIVRIGTITVASTGANRDDLAAAGVPFRTLHLHPNQHAGYFPGASAMHLVVHIGDDGALLGAQAAGHDGVDKRIDVLATAMRAGLGAADLIDLDLAYAPPYGQAKDGVNLIGMVAENLLAGRLRLWYAEDATDGADALVLDVRRADEFASGHLPGALNIPHTELRGRLDEVRIAAAGRPVRVMCAAGVRSNIAYRILVGGGIEATSLSGGIQTLRQWFGRDADQVLTSEGVHA